MVEETAKTCFVIMPITTPKMYEERYRDADHFRHVGECLFEPAIRKAGFEPIFPESKGSTNIYSDIITNLETADLVLCDMSILNPNVFFEFGIRTALNKPICLVKDEYLGIAPFDTAPINHHIYSSNLSSWIVSVEIEKLAQHIRETPANNGDTNPLWKHFGFNDTANKAGGVSTEDDRFNHILQTLNYITAQLTSQEATVRNPKQRVLINVNGELVRPECTFTDREYIQAKMNDLISKYLTNYNNLTYQMTPSGDIYQINITGVVPFNDEFVEELRALGHKYHFKYQISA